MIYSGNTGRTKGPDLLFLCILGHAALHRGFFIPGCNVPLSLRKSVVVAAMYMGRLEAACLGAMHY